MGNEIHELLWNIGPVGVFTGLAVTAGMAVAVGLLLEAPHRRLQRILDQYRAGR